MIGCEWRLSGVITSGAMRFARLLSGSNRLTSSGTVVILVLEEVLDHAHHLLLESIVRRGDRLGSVQCRLRRSRLLLPLNALQLILNVRELLL